MGKITLKKFTSPDETRAFAGHGELDLIELGGATVGRARFEPGWRWSVDLKPLAGTKSCDKAHVAYVLSGRMAVRMDDGEEVTFEPGDMMYVPPGHDAWTLGDKACVVLDFQGFEEYARPSVDAEQTLTM